MDGWYVGVNGQQRGPLSLDEVVEAVRASGADQTYVWREGLGEWKLAADVPDIAGRLRAAPPMSPSRPMPPDQRRAQAAAHPVQVFATGSGTGVSFGGAISSCFSKYATFRGRAPRSEYWYWVLFVFLAIIVTLILDTIIAVKVGFPLYPLTILFWLAAIIPGISVTVRRLHDIDFTGWWFWLAIVPVGSFVLLVFHLMRGTTGPNNYGEDPLGG